MALPVFQLEAYLTEHEFSAPYVLGCSDPESMAMHDLLAMASADDLAEWETLTLKYTEPYGDPRLREQIAQSLYPTLEAKHILCTAGAEEGIFTTLHVLCNPDDHIIVLTPCYQSLKEIPVLKGAKITEVKLRESEHWKINLSRLQAAVTPETTGLIINFPHNPTGQVLTQAELDPIIQLCEQHNLWLFADEVYRLLGNPSQPWAKPVAELYPKAISLGVMSKAFGLPGLRVGWLACQDTQLINRIKTMKDYLSICNSAPSEQLSIIALKNKGHILSRINGIVQQNLHQLDAFFDRHSPLFQWVRPEGGCVGYVRYTGNETADTFCRNLIETQGVLLLPGSVYEPTDQYFRIGFGRQSMPASLARLEAFLTK